MIAKTFEIRDTATFIPVLAVKMEPGCEADRYLFARTGFGRDAETQAEYVMVMRLAGGSGRATCDPYDWTDGSRTLIVAHEHIIRNFDRLQSGAVVDVEHILGLSSEAKRSEQETAP